MPTYNLRRCNKCSLWLAVCCSAALRGRLQDMTGRQVQWWSAPLHCAITTALCFLPPGPPQPPSTLFPPGQFTSIGTVSIEVDTWKFDIAIYKLGFRRVSKNVQILFAGLGQKICTYFVLNVGRSNFNIQRLAQATCAFLPLLPAVHHSALRFAIYKPSMIIHGKYCELIFWWMVGTLSSI